jgi:hypothetical protein
MDQLKEFVSEKQSIIKDGWCGEPIMWGRYIVKRLGEEEFTAVRQKHNVQYIDGNWMVIEKVLTRDEAITKYGEVTNEEFGVRGGWKSVTFGNKKFINKLLK